ncbi:hypothetical protein BXZ70DRAFT_1064101 [Cristinia sonorae]|uniref:Uncharacterized protein n=1 Tax=Cristinia sonorae TaxID=1940300 RepID=A0A8K0UQ05_9AGAR|nr:hypothetical protein BXZ70DRAFT_1064101 [Cristinia sonorae]
MSSTTTFQFIPTGESVQFRKFKSLPGTKRSTRRVYNVLGKSQPKSKNSQRTSNIRVKRTSASKSTSATLPPPPSPPTVNENDNDPAARAELVELRTYLKIRRAAYRQRRESEVREQEAHEVSWTSKRKMLDFGSLYIDITVAEPQPEEPAVVLSEDIIEPTNEESQVDAQDQSTAEVVNEAISVVPEQSQFEVSQSEDVTSGAEDHSEPAADVDDVEPALFLHAVTQDPEVVDASLNTTETNVVPSDNASIVELTEDIDFETQTLLTVEEQFISESEPHVHGLSDTFQATNQTGALFSSTTDAAVDTSELPAIVDIFDDTLALPRVDNYASQLYEDASSLVAFAPAADFTISDRPAVDPSSTLEPVADDDDYPYNDDADLTLVSTISCEMVKGEDAPMDEDNMDEDMVVDLSPAPISASSFHNRSTIPIQYAVSDEDTTMVDDEDMPVQVEDILFVDDVQATTVPLCCPEIEMTASPVVSMSATPQALLPAFDLSVPAPSGSSAKSTRKSARNAPYDASQRRSRKAAEDFTAFVSQQSPVLSDVGNSPGAGSSRTKRAAQPAIVNFFQLRDADRKSKRRSNPLKAARRQRRGQHYEEPEDQDQEDQENVNENLNSAEQPPAPSSPIKLVFSGAMFRKVKKEVAAQKASEDAALESFAKLNVAASQEHAQEQVPWASTLPWGQPTSEVDEVLEAFNRWMAS